jgi:hypothetical protein
MLVLNCKNMRRLVHASAAIFLFGIALQLVINLFEPGDPLLPGFMPYLVYCTLVTGPLLLLLVLVITLTRGRKSSTSASAGHPLY